MPIILHLDRVMADRKMTLNELADKVGITNVNMSRIKTGKVRAIRFSTLDAICEVLDCQPGDILKHISADRSRNFSSDARGNIIVDDSLVDEYSDSGL
ncbi:helix-turn-helix domain-containing protein [Gordonibacter sp.]|uniref:helix-turn-helix domain-containing protein n=1 Tax=Gordonibacter sp. TaxID=1968902 RepID=UPI002FCC9952